MKTLPDPISRRVWLRLALAAAILMGFASAGGIWLPFVYVQETASWAAQGTGQDIVNLAVVLPAMLIALYAASAGSLRALLVVLGLLIYLVYSYVLYAFFVHFNLLFLIYVATLGTSFWALVGIVLDVRHDQIRELFEGKTGRAQSAYLMISGLLFGVLWISSIASSIVSATRRGTSSRSVCRSTRCTYSIWRSSSRPWSSRRSCSGNGIRSVGYGRFRW